MTPRALVIGGGGMLGHQVWRALDARFETRAAVREWRPAFGRVGPRAREQAIEGVDARRFDTVERALAEFRPHFVVNAAGVVKQAAAATDPIASIEVNALFPHRMAAACEAVGAKLAHVSTDCVFSGRKGRYTETDEPDPIDLYGRTKLLGEPGGGALTLRTSIVGRELDTAHGLVEWFLSNRGGRVRGFSRAVFSGLSTGVLAVLIADILERRPDLSGLHHVAAERIDKHALLTLLNEAYGAGVEIEPDDDVVIDRSLDGRAFAAATGFRAPPWAEMIEAMAAEDAAYAGARA
ncbi:MAG: SDR family oxidoreductase [Dehalococcoidia bacterium]|nr:SDR family oxidoreductase [Dehalococcoidia bacterium]